MLSQVIWYGLLRHNTNLEATLKWISCGLNILASRRYKQSIEMSIQMTSRTATTGVPAL